jgi:hypothetical protein
MTTPADESTLHELEIEVEAELAIAASSNPEEAAGGPAVEWLYAQADAERQEAGLRSLLGAVEALETGYRPRHSAATAAPEH